MEKFDGHLLSRNHKKVFRSNEHKEHVKEQIARRIKGEPKRGTSRWVSVAATIMLLLGLGYLTYKRYDAVPPVEPIVEIVKTTEWGKKLTLTLPDGSEVRLNSGSTLKFPERFEGDVREVELSGEAFFEVTKNSDKPFIIKSDEVNTTVLGTSFNVNTYPENQQISVTVATGRVKVASRESEVFLGPNEQGVFDKDTKSISKEKIDIASFMYWKDGIIHFEDVELSNVLESLERWYGVTFVMDNHNIGGCHITATYDNDALSEVLESIVYAKKGLHYEFLEDKKILIQGACTD